MKRQRLCSAWLITAVCAWGWLVWSYLDACWVFYLPGSPSIARIEGRNLIYESFYEIKDSGRSYIIHTRTIDLDTSKLSETYSDRWTDQGLEPLQRPFSPLSIDCHPFRLESGTPGLWMHTQLRWFHWILLKPSGFESRTFDNLMARSKALRPTRGLFPGSGSMLVGSSDCFYLIDLDAQETSHELGTPMQSIDWTDFVDSHRQDLLYWLEASPLSLSRDSTYATAMVGHDSSSPRLGAICVDVSGKRAFFREGNVVHTAPFGSDEHGSTDPYYWILNYEQGLVLKQYSFFQDKPLRSIQIDDKPRIGTAQEPIVFLGKPNSTPGRFVAFRRTANERYLFDLDALGPDGTPKLNSIPHDRRLLGVVSIGGQDYCVMAHDESGSFELYSVKQEKTVWRHAMDRLRDPIVLKDGFLYAKLPGDAFCIDFNVDSLEKIRVVDPIAPKEFWGIWFPVGLAIVLIALAFAIWWWGLYPGVMLGALTTSLFILEFAPHYYSTGHTLSPGLSALLTVCAVWLAFHLIYDQFGLGWKVLHVGLVLGCIYFVTQFLCPLVPDLLREPLIYNAQIFLVAMILFWFVRRTGYAVRSTRTENPASEEDQSKRMRILDILLIMGACAVVFETCRLYKAPGISAQRGVVVLASILEIASLGAVAVLGLLRTSRLWHVPIALAIVGILVASLPMLLPIDNRIIPQKPLASLWMSDNLRHAGDAISYLAPLLVVLMSFAIYYRVCGIVLIKKT